MTQTINAAMDCARRVVRERSESFKLFSKLLDGVFPDNYQEPDYITGDKKSLQQVMSYAYLYAQTVKNIAERHATYGKEHLQKIICDKVTEIGAYVAKLESFRPDMLSVLESHAGTSSHHL